MRYIVLPLATLCLSLAMAEDKFLILNDIHYSPNYTIPSGFMNHTEYGVYGQDLSYWDSPLALIELVLNESKQTIDDEG